ncbi:MAG: HipA domain-containing protein [Bacteroidia bacterium]|nr:HipA domain-containing protein [Bacteroidia bacterium]
MLAYGLPAAGITMMPSSLIEIGGEQHFITERFDRKAGGAKVFTQTLSAVNPSASSYEDLFRTARKQGVPQKEIDELFARTAFNFLAGNVDDHNKNFSFLMDGSGLWHISPAYDMTFTVELGDELQNYHFLPLMGKVKNISDKDLLEFARMNDVRSPDKILEKVKCAIEKFPSFAGECGVDALTAKRINDYLQRLLG